MTIAMPPSATNTAMAANTIRRSARIMALSRKMLVP
jgi:hypothetical protein